MKKIEKKIILNLGCGKTQIPETIGVDYIKHSPNVDVAHNLDMLPYPFKTNSVDEIHMYHVLEHLHNPLKIMEELHRILKPKGILHLRVPHFSSLGAFTDITHIRPFGYNSFDIFQKSSFQHYYTSVTYEIVHKRIKYFGLYPNDGVYAQYVHANHCHLVIRPFVRLMNLLISLSPVAFERLWCYWVGGAMELVIDLKKIK